MTKTEFITKFAEARNIPKKQAAEDVNAFLEIITDAVADDGNVTFPGVFTIKKVHKQEREMKAPTTGKKITVPAHYAVKLKAGTGFAEKLNK